MQDHGLGSRQVADSQARSLSGHSPVGLHGRILKLPGQSKLYFGLGLVWSGLVRLGIEAVHCLFLPDRHGRSDR